MNTFLPFKAIFKLSTFESDNLNLTNFKFCIISDMSSLTPGMVENSCKTFSTFTLVMAAPGKLVKSTRLKAFPMVTP